MRWRHSRNGEVQKKLVIQRKFYGKNFEKTAQLPESALVSVSKRSAAHTAANLSMSCDGWEVREKRQVNAIALWNRKCNVCSGEWTKESEGAEEKTERGRSGCERKQAIEEKERGEIAKGGDKMERKFASENMERETMGKKNMAREQMETKLAREKGENGEKYDT